MKLHQASGVIDHTLRMGGGTFCGITGEAFDLQIGYMVGGFVPTATVDMSGDYPDQRHAVAKRAVAAFCNTHADVLSRGTTYLGTWMHEGTLYIDASEQVTGEDHALQVAASRGELAIWDNATGCEVTA